MYEDLIKSALQEDLGLGGDITSQAIFSAKDHCHVVIASRENGVISGLDVAAEVFKTHDPSLKIEALMKDGDTIKKGDQLMSVAGSTLSILSAERTALNLLMHFCGIASETAKYVAAVTGTKTRIVDTRKTLPGMRALQKKAVRDGGGANHRFGLFDAVLIKDNHIAACGGDIVETVKRVKAYIGHMVKIEAEVDTLEQLKKILDSGIDVVLLDNMSPAQIKEAISMIDGRFLSEASGGINLSNVADYAKMGVDYISVGALTHSVKALDLGLDYKDKK